MSDLTPDPAPPTPEELFGEPEPAAEDPPAEDPPFEADPTRRPRGFLESDVKRITDKFVTGELVLPEGAALTPHFLGLAIKTEDGLDECPSTGAVNAVLKRWEEYGFITVSEKPYGFTGYTQAAIDDGLTALEGAHSDRKKVARKAAKEAQAQAAA